MRSCFAFIAAVFILGSSAAGAANAAQPRTPCDQLGERLYEIRAQSEQIQADYAAAVDAGDMAALVAVGDRLVAILAEADVLLQRMDECSRSPIPALAD